MPGSSSVGLLALINSSISSDNLKLQAFLRSKGLLASRKTCKVCSTEMKLEPTSTALLDGVQWRCPIQSCRTTVSTREGSFFSTSRLPLRKLVPFLYLWSSRTPVNQISKGCQMSKKTVIEWCSFARDIRSRVLLT